MVLKCLIGDLVGESNGIGGRIGGGELGGKVRWTDGRMVEGKQGAVEI